MEEIITTDFGNQYLSVRSDSNLTEQAFAVAFSTTIAYEFVNLFFENRVLRHVIKNQWRSFKYNQEYIQFLLGGYSEEEFLKIAENYALPFAKIDNVQLTRGASVVLHVLGETVTSGDLSSLLNIDPLVLETALESYPFVSKSKEIEEE